ncbi:DUF6318 family protein [Arthrobacter sp. B10-11]|uniref:DUF6318 family protein n=1 Tax=Arthrobacter sp. B10-11 TaxID=3081160 RepID=UPI002955C786|nr:DUF6318 family protein [Arthrobacter sp. B10-11]MDV8149597.1 DUF6318 family protein [Arthrobacter sp. B10-11]
MTSRTSALAQWRYSAAAVFAASVLVLSACNGGGNPQGTGGASESASASASASPSPSPTPTPSAAYKPADASGKAQNVPVPVLPEAAKAETKEGLEAFAKYWYATLSYAYETGDVTPLQAVSATTCASCHRVKEVVEAWHSEGRWLAGGKMVVQGVQSKFVETAPGEYQVLIQVFQEPLSYYRSDKTLDEKTEQKPAAGDIMLASYDGGAWRANTVEHLANSQ